MPPGEHDDRRVEIYFGPSNTTTISKAEVAEFITDEMGLVRSNGGPKWSDGITTLVELGVDSWENRKQETQVNRGNNVPDVIAAIAELKEFIDTKLEEVRNGDSYDPKEAELRNIESKASILAALSREPHQGVKSPNYADISEIANDTGLDYETVSFFCRLLSKSSRKFVKFDDHGGKIKSPMMTAFCNSVEFTGLTPTLSSKI